MGWWKQRRRHLRGAGQGNRSVCGQDARLRTHGFRLQWSVRIRHLSGHRVRPGQGHVGAVPEHDGGAGAFGAVVQTGPTLDTSQLQPGDVIYYDGGQGVAGAHVAIYMGNGVTVETNESGTPVHSQAATTSNGPVRVVRPN
ncbi:NlpC/P60 family protein [Mycolicibacterium fortuitum]